MCQEVKNTKYLRKIQLFLTINPGEDDKSWLAIAAIPILILFNTKQSLKGSGGQKHIYKKAPGAVPRAEKKLGSFNIIFLAPINQVPCETIRKCPILLTILKSYP